jgi:exodeoxyribonuclease V alpha subunit
MDGNFILQAEENTGPLTAHTLRGEILRIVFENDDKTYVVMKLIDSQEVEHTVVGSITGAYPGQDIEVSGRWETHQEYGRQLRAEAYRFLLPSTREGIARYLASGVIPGIGPKYAQNIVEHFGEKTLEILDHSSGRLREVPGLGKKRIEQIRKAWQGQSLQKDIFIFLQSLGITPAYCMRIYKRYGDETPDKVRSNPYALASEVDGIGFTMADRVAAALGVEKNNVARLASGINYTLGQLTLAGHTCYPRVELLRSAAETLEVTVDEAAAGLERAAAARQIVLCPDPEFGELVYPRPLYIAEYGVPEMIARLASVPRFAGKRLLKVPARNDLALSDEQQLAVERVGASPLTIITGGPGVGKTTVIGEIVRRAKAARLKIMMAAPTGRAARRMYESTEFSAKTIHRMLKWDPGERRFVFDSSNQLNCDLLIVDEVSMLDAVLAYSLFQAIPPGTSVVLVGDADQLPSVGPGRVLHCFIESGIFLVTHLSKIFRQGAGSFIIRNAHRVNSGQMPESGVQSDELTDFYWIEQDDPEKVLEVIRRLVCERIPERFGLRPADDIQLLTPMNRGNCGTIGLNAMLQEVLNGGNKPQFKAGERVFKTGDKVMQISNNYDKGVFNGDMGRVAHIDAHEKKFIVIFDSNQSVEYDMAEYDQLNLAYAITVHKSQGSEFPAVVMPLLSQHYMMLQRNLLYTGMTRARKLLILIGSRRAISMAVNNSRLEPRFTRLRERLAERIAPRSG